MGFLFGLLISLAFAGGDNDKNYPRCEALLESTNILRHFRGAADFQETKNGVWARRGNRMVFFPDEGDPRYLPLENEASHLEIIRKQIGDQRFKEIMTSPSSGDELSRVLAEIAIRAEDPANIRDAEELLEEIDQIPAHQPLSSDMELHVFTLLKKMERLALPMTDWLKPKVLNNRLNQLPAISFDHRPIENRIGKRVLVYKASLVTVLLAKQRSFIISSGAYSLADNLHSVAQNVLNKILPVQRFFNRRDAVPGYLVVYGDDETFMKGRIEFVKKADLSVEMREHYDFN